MKKNCSYKEIDRDILIQLILISLLTIFVIIDIFVNKSSYNSPVEENVIDSIQSVNKTIIIEVNNLDSIKNEKIIEVKALDNDSTISLFYQLIR